MEEWREIEHCPDYEVSSMGNVRRIDTGKILKPYDNGRGYAVVDVKDARRTGHESRWARTVHKMVAEAFLGPCTMGLEVHHKNGVKRDNRVVNLEYTTRSLNMKHAFASGVVDIAKAHRARTFFLRDSKGRYIRRASVEHN